MRLELSEVTVKNLRIHEKWKHITGIVAHKLDRESYCYCGFWLETSEAPKRHFNFSFQISSSHNTRHPMANPNLNRPEILATALF